MSDNQNDEDRAIKFMNAECETNGIGTVQVSDGNIFMFSSHFLEKMLALSNESEDKKVVIFVQHANSAPTPEQAKA